ncbi:MAG: HAAS signaling domain-containing protein [Stackebrandtia sp.]
MTTETLTERYVHEVVRRIPAEQRDDVAAELRATIADAVDARATDDAEREVLTEMGDPIRLAAGYADRPLALIGPDLYPAYIRLLKLLLSVVLPVIVVVFAALDIADGAGLDSIISGAVGAVLTVGGQMIAWATVVFALIERADKRSRPVKEWTVDRLPEQRSPGRVSGHAIAALLWDALLIGVTVWQHVAKPYRTDSGKDVEILNPELWSGWIWPILAGLAGLVVLSLIRAAGQRVTVRMATWHAAAHAVFALPLVWVLYRQEFFNPEFLADFNHENPGPFYTGVAVIVLISSAIEVYKRFKHAER